jgi:hypothetical protein
MATCTNAAEGDNWAKMAKKTRRSGHVQSLSASGSHRFRPLDIRGKIESAVVVLPGATFSVPPFRTTIECVSKGVNR